MNQHIRWKHRLLSAVLAAAICLTMLPAQALAFAQEGQAPGSTPGSSSESASGSSSGSSFGSSMASSSASASSGSQPEGQPDGESAPGSSTGTSFAPSSEDEGGAGNAPAGADVRVEWLPQQPSVASGTAGTVTLRAQLGEGVSRAEVSVALDAQEAAALREFRNEQGELTDGAALDANGTALVLSLTEDGAVLSFSLDETHPAVEQNFTFQVPNGVSAPFCISVKDSISAASGEKPNLVLSAQAQDMEVTAEYKGWQASITGPQAELKPTEDGVLPDFAFQLSAISENTAAAGALYTQSQSASLSLELPQGISLPEGQALCENNVIRIGGTPVATLAGLAQNTEVTAAVQGNALHITLRRTAPQGQSAELEDISGLTFAFAGEAFAVAPGFAGAAITLSGTLENTPAAGQAPAPQQLGAASAQVLATWQGGLGTGRPEEASVAIDEWLSSFNRTLYWVDNHNEAALRPDTAQYPQPILKFRLDGTGEFVQLTQENMAQLGLQQMPQAAVSQAGVGSYLVTVGDYTLPVKYTEIDPYGDETQHTVEWQIEPAACEGYAIQKVEQEELPQFPSAGGKAGWYYVLQTDLTFGVRLRWGTLGSAPGISQAIAGHFALTVQTGQASSQYLLADLGDDLVIERDPSSDPNNPTSGTMKIGNAWKYNLDGTQITYSIREAEGQQTGQVTIPSLQNGDYFAISYDNASAPNFGSVTDRLYSGGTLYLTLTGRKTYDAHKVWLDEGVAAGAQSQRPTGEFQLWRYRKGQPSTTAAPVRRADGAIVTLPLDTGVDEQELLFDALEKYDAEGYEYLYVVREYLDSTTLDGAPARSYEQVFGKVDAATGSITDRIEQDGELVDITTPNVRPAGNTFLYNGGTLSNRITDAVEAAATKVWKASAFQSEFEDVVVELTLQSRVKGQPGAQWQATGVTQRMEQFFAENLSASVRRTMPRYDASGQELEYRWVESAVYQGAGSEENLFAPDGTGGGTFTLAQGGRTVQYRSAIRQAGSAGKGYSTTVTNTIANTIQYEVAKVWLDENGETQPPQGATATFAIYRMRNGEALGEPVAVFSVDGTADAEPTVVNKALGILAQETAPWQATVTPLDEFDENGGQYQYLLLEQGGTANFIPTYKTERDEQGYHTTVYNGPGEGNRIMVRKGWVDDSDISHREAVTVAVYDRATNEKVNEVTLGGGVWYAWVGIGQRAPEDVYILETQVGGTPVPLTEDPANFTQPQAPEEYDGPGDDTYTAIPYETDYHRYEVTYSHEVLQGVTFYTAANRRFGNIDFTATKTWQDGTGELRAQIAQQAEESGYSLVMQLEFARQDVPAYYAISRGRAGGDTVAIGSPADQVPIADSTGAPVASRQKLDFTQKESTYEFFELPKYDRTGAAVQYTVREVWLNADGEEVEVSQLPEGLQNLLADYRTAYGEPQYEASGHREADKQFQQVTNSLSGTKTAVWNKIWKDDAIYEAGQRPDIYLDIYQVRHDENGNPQASLRQANYKWTYLDEEGTSLAEYWVAELSGLPKYDEYGYEIIYYAVEHTTVDAQSFDYLPVAYGMGERGSLRDIGTALELNEDVQQGDTLDLALVSGAGNDAAAKYALRETGTFTNAIYQTVTVQGQKLWASLPAGYPRVDLPNVEFGLYRRLAQQSEAEAVQVASLKVEEWASVYQNGSYRFRMEYEGGNIMTAENGAITISPEQPGAARLPQYDAEGRLYLYTLKENSVTWPNGTTQPESGLVYADPVINTYLVENKYESVKGATAVKKFLELPMDASGQPEAFPAITFVLTRTYRAQDGTTSASETVQRLTWSSAEVQAAYQAAQNKTAPLEVTLRFENLDIYAPNGEAYQYAISEDKQALGGYDTWGMPGDGTPEILRGQPGYAGQTSVEKVRITLNEGNGRGQTADEVYVGATFLNAPQPARETVALSGTKQWRDYSNQFGLRPGDVTLTVSRYADAQPGQGNAIAKEEMPAGSYAVVWDEASKAGDTWRYSVTGARAGELERYAPNGMPWRYEVTETLPAGSEYTMSPANGTVGEQSRSEAGGALSVTMRPLTNTILTSAPYSKGWVDSAGGIITEDYLGFDLAVTFQLQVIEADGKGGQPASGAKWADAGTYFEKALSPQAYQALFGSYSFTQTQTGRINDSAVWGKTYSFANLPSVISNSTGGLTYLRYRVVEAGIAYNGAVQTVTVVNEDGAAGTYQYEFSPGLFSPAYWANGKNQPETEYNLFKTQALYNRLETTEFSVAKQWVGDGGNAYGTRPETGRTGFDWEASFVIQRSADGGASWENVTVYQNGAEQDLTLTLYGTNRQSYASAAVAGLPQADESGRQYAYRVRELQTGWQQREQAGRVNAADILDANAIYNTAYTAAYDDAAQIVSNTLRPTRIYAEKQWNPSAAPVPVTFALEYLAEGGAWTKLAQVTVYGTADTQPQAPYYEYKAWNAVWENLPQAMPGSSLAQGGKTQYRVTETLPGGYLQQASEQATIETGGTEYPLFRYVNVEATRLAVEKVWHGTPQAQQGDVVVGLWRTTGTPGDAASEEVAGAGGQQTLVLTRANHWQGSFANLPKYDAAGQAYTYYARELSVGGRPVKDPDFCFAVHYEDAQGKTTVTNTWLQELSGTKTWNDGSNAAGLRPDAISLTLWRTAAGGQPEQVTDAQPVWTGTDTEVWRYTYYKLPAADEQGNLYTYAVKEEPVAGYEVQQTGYALKNTLVIDIPVKKLWTDSGNAAGIRPASVDIALYANGAEAARVRLTPQGGQLLTSGAGEAEETAAPSLWQRLVRSMTRQNDAWSYTFTGLPQYDANGSFITYTVEEVALPDGYGEVIYGGNAGAGFTVENVALGGLRVEKKVEGAQGDKSRAFHFTVTLSDTSVNGTYGGMTFHNGVAGFALKHGESVQAQGLPGGVRYTVAEQEANADGYATTQTGESGTIPAGGTAAALFTNRKDPPGGGIVKTGDGANPLLYAGLLAACLAGFAGALAWGRRRKGAPPAKK